MANVAEDTNGRKYVTLPRIRRLPLNPHILGGMDTRLLAPASSVGHTSHTSAIEFQEDKTLLHELLRVDQRSFLTRSANPDLQACHIINTVRKDKERKEQVESFLTEQAIVQGSSAVFRLDSVYNGILLEAGLHIHWDVYGTFCIVPSYSDALRIQRGLEAANVQWENKSREKGFIVPRPLDVSDASFRDPSWELIVLHAKGLLPDNQPLPILEHPPIYQNIPGTTAYSIPPPTSPPLWNFWVARGDQLCRHDNRNAFLPSFKVSSARSSDCVVSVLAMIINAQVKLEQFVNENPASITPRIDAFATMMSQLTMEIFFRPTLLVNPPIPSSSSAMSSVEGGEHSAAYNTPPSAIAMSPPPVAPSWSQFDSSPSAGEEKELRGGPPEPTDPNRSSSSGCPESQSDCPETPQEDGLTDSEFRRLEEMARDPSLDGKERANAAMLMIFGTQGFIDPVADRASVHAHEDEELGSESDVA